MKIGADDWKRHADLSDDEVSSLVEVGISAEKRSGTMIIRDFLPVVRGSRTEGLDILSISEALERYPWVRERYFWKAVPSDLDEYTARIASESRVHGYFIHLRKGIKATLPCQAAVYLATEDLTQTVHNIIIVEDDAELRIISGCVSGKHVRSGSHFSVDEQYVGKRAKLVSTMIHGWGPSMDVQPRSGAIVDEDGRFESTYVSLRPAKTLKSNPQTHLVGQRASTRHQTIVLCERGSVIDLGGDVYLEADDTSAELIHRGVCTGGKLYQNGLLMGKARCHAHVDCAGMLIDPDGLGSIESVPGIKAQHTDAILSHEASIGKIAPDQVEYLLSRGFEEREAISLLIRGFLGPEIEQFDVDLDNRIAAIADLAGHGEA